MHLLCLDVQLLLTASLSFLQLLMYPLQVREDGHVVRYHRRADPDARRARAAAHQRWRPEGSERCERGLHVMRRMK